MLFLLLSLCFNFNLVIKILLPLFAFFKEGRSEGRDFLFKLFFGKNVASKIN